MKIGTDSDFRGKEEFHDFIYVYNQEPGQITPGKNIQRTSVTTTAFVLKYVAIKMNLLL